MVTRSGRQVSAAKPSARIAQPRAPIRAQSRSPAAAGETPGLLRIGSGYRSTFIGVSVTAISTVDQAAKAMRDEEMLQEIEDFIEGFNQPTYRGMRVSGQRIATWSSQYGWSGL
jgi:hypothetical protein